MKNAWLNRLKNVAESGLRFIKSDALIAIPLALAALMWLLTTVETAISLFT